MTTNRFFIPSLILAAAFLISTLVISGTWRRVKSDQTINVTGSAKKVMVSDLGFLRGSISAEAATASLAYRALETQKPILLEYLRSKGFPADKIELQTINNYPNYSFNQNGQQTGIRSYSASQMFSIQSSDVNLIKAVSLEISSLVERGVSLQINPPEYHYTKIGDIKIEIQAEAAKDAMVRGQRIAQSTGRELGTLKSARMGVLQITPENSNMTSDYGINDVSSIRKEITAVVSANFAIQ